MRSRQPGMSPEKIAIAVAVTIAAIAGMGAMKKVTGTSSAVAMVAVRPGTAPTNRPKSDAPSITRMVLGSNTIANAWPTAVHMLRIPSRSPRVGREEPPGQRHAQQFVEGEMNEQRHDRR